MQKSVFIPLISNTRLLFRSGERLHSEVFNEHFIPAQ